MKSWLLCRGYLLLSIIAFASLGPLHAQNFTVLHSFSATATNQVGVVTNSDGVGPYKLVLSGDTFYGIAYAGSPLGTGTLFAVKSNGTGFTNLHNFSGPTDGANPNDLVISSNVLYGTANNGGYANSGTIFSMRSDGTGFENLYAFSLLQGATFGQFGINRNSDGGNPVSVCLSSNNVLFGAAELGDPGGLGTVFSLNSDGTGFDVVFDRFNVIGAPSAPGAFPNGVIISDDMLYGTAESGSGYAGVVFALNTNGNGYTILHSFTLFTTNTDGWHPGNLLLSGNTLYGTAEDGGSPGFGALFAVNTDGTGFRNPHIFQGPSVNDGANPRGRMTLLGNTLYGTTAYGGPLDRGTIFQINTDGSGYAVLYTFSGTNDGYHPVNAMTLVGNTLYGVTTAGGSGGNGTIFSFSLPPSLTMTPSLTINTSGTNLVISWPTNFTGRAIQSATNLNSPDWTTNLSAPVIVNGQYTVSNSVSGQQQFFRLSQP